MKKESMKEVFLVKNRNKILFAILCVKNHTHTTADIRYIEKACLYCPDTIAFVCSNPTEVATPKTYGNLLPYVRTEIEGNIILLKSILIYLVEGIYTVEILRGHRKTISWGGLRFVSFEKRMLENTEKTNIETLLSVLSENESITILLDEIQTHLKSFGKRDRKVQ